MLINLFAGLFHKRCPLCKQEVQTQGLSAVKRFGKWFCSTLHADFYEMDLYKALRTVHYRHTGCHEAQVPWPEGGGMDISLKQALELARADETLNTISAVGSKPSSSDSD